MGWEDYYRFRFRHVHGGSPPLIAGLRGTIVALGIPFIVAVGLLSGIRHLKSRPTTEADLSMLVVGAFYLLAALSDLMPRLSCWLLLLLAAVVAVVSSALGAVALTDAAASPAIPASFAAYSAVVAWAAFRSISQASKLSA